MSKVMMTDLRLGKHVARVSQKRTNTSIPTVRKLQCHDRTDMSNNHE